MEILKIWRDTSKKPLINALQGGGFTLDPFKKEHNCLSGGCVFSWQLFVPVNEGFRSPNNPACSVIMLVFHSSLGAFVRDIQHCLKLLKKYADKF